MDIHACANRWPRLWRRWKRVATLVSLHLGILGFAGSGGHRQAVPDAGLEAAAVEVRTALVAQAQHRPAEEVMGTVRSRFRAVIEAKVTGRIERFEAVPGRKVESGAVLVELDVREIRARLEQAKAVLEQAEKDYQRVEGLFGQEAVTKAEVEAAESRRRVARAGVVESEAMLGYARITAPFAGVVTRKLADVGDLAVPGRPLLELEDPNVLRFEADVPAALVELVRLGEELGIRVAGAGTDVPLTGRVSEIEPSADPVSRTFRVRLDLPLETAVRGGSFGRMLLPLAPVAVTTVPTNAISMKGQMELAWVVVDGRVRLRIVKTGKRLGADWEILSGLEKGEVVVTGAPQGPLADGRRVVVP